MKNTLSLICIAGLCMMNLLLLRQAFGAQDDVSQKVAPLTDEEQALFEGAAKIWFRRFWTNDCSRCKVGFEIRKIAKRPWMTRVDVRFRINGKLCNFSFADRNPNKPVFISSHLYQRIISYAGEKDHSPIHTTKGQARARVSEFAALFGVSNLWDKTHFNIYVDGGFNSTGETWDFDFWTVRNGYPFPDGIHVSIADLPDAPLASWHNTQDNVPPEQLPTNVVLTSEQACAKSLEYMKKYFPFHAAALYRGQMLEKGDVLEIQCVTNMLEYVIPNYNYIRPAPGSGGLSDYVPPNRELALAWVNHLGTPKDSKYKITALIYVDAATGEMLGGSD